MEDDAVDACVDMVTNRNCRTILECCLVCFFLAVGGGMLGSGASSLSDADSRDYRQTTCDVRSISYMEGSTTNCHYQVTTLLTKDRMWDWKGKCGFITPDAIDICPKSTKCSGPCYLVYESAATDAEPKEISDADVEVGETFIGLVLTAMGTMSMCLSCAGCFCMRLDYLAAQPPQQSKESLKKNVDPERIGNCNATPPNAPQKTSVDIEKYENGVSGCLSFTGTILTFFAVVGAIGGVYVACVLKYFHSRGLIIGGQELPAEAAMAGFGISCFCMLCVLFLWLGIYLLKTKLKKTLECLALNSNSEEEMQQMFAQMVVDKLRSEQGEKYRGVLLEAGIGEDQITRLLTAPPDEICNQALELLAGRILAEIVCSMIEGVVRPQFESQLHIFSITFLGFPAALVALVLWLSAFCVQFAVPTSATVVAALMFLSCGFLLLDWTKVYIMAFSVLNVAFWIVIFTLWVKDGPTALSVLLWMLSTIHFWGWFIMSSIWACYVKPLAEALFEYALEDFRVGVWTGCGCQRDPQHLLQRREDVINVGGCLGRKLGVARLLTEEHGRE